MSVLYSYYCTLKMQGDIIERDETIYWVDVTYAITWLDDASHGSLVFSEEVNFDYLKVNQNQNFYNMFNIYWHDINFKTNELDRKLLDFEVTEYQEDKKTINFTMTFEQPYMLGLLLKKSDKIFIDRNADFVIDKNAFFYDTNLTAANETIPDDQKNKFANASWHRLHTNSSSMRIEMQFDYRNANMMLYRRIAENMYWVLIGLIVVQFLLLLWRGVGLQPVWVLIEYLQLVSFMPIYNFRFIPYLYDAFKPALVSHMIIFDETPLYDELDQDFFNKNYKNYWLSVGRLLQAFFFYCVFLFIIVVFNIITAIFYKLNVGTVRSKAWMGRRMVQFKFNIYIRYYMLVYFDTTFFAVMKIFEGNNRTAARKVALLASYVVFVINIVLPVILVTTIYRRFDILKIKEAKQSFNTLLLRIDKNSKVRVVVPAYFFLRRCLTACLLTLPINNTFIFLQYVFILMSSHAFVLYMVAIKPFQTSGINWYVLANETFYSTLIIAMFIFSDATPELTIKFGAAVALISSLVLIVVANLLTNIVYICRGKRRLK